MKAPGNAILRHFSLLAVSICFLFEPPAPALALCTLNPTPGDDSYTCDSPGNTSLTDLSGNNSLTFPANGNGSIPGNVTFGAGDDRVLMQSGAITGVLDMGDGQNVLQIDNGTLSGAVHQGNGVDTFIMHGGTIASLTQGDGFDRFTMTGGTITGAFEDGDFAQMSGGTIGRVDMKLDENVFELSGGQIIGNLVTGFDNDTIRVSGGRIGGNLSVSGGNDSITLTGGEIAGEIRAGTGDDRFVWDGGGIVRSAVLMGDGNDSAILRNLDDSLLALTPRLDGGSGNDVLTFDNSHTALAQRYANWETINLNNGSRMDVGADSLILGDAGTGRGVLNIDASSTLTSAQGVVSAAVAGQPVTLNNAGVIDLTGNNNRTSDTLTVQGNYVGAGGHLRLQSVVAGDDAPSDRLVVNNGSLSGSTLISVTNLGGNGALTAQNGIQLVQAPGSSLSNDSAFSLASPVSAGAYDYRLFKGGVTAGTENNWYLRSAIVAPAVVSVPNPEPGLAPIQVPVVAAPVAAVAPAGSPPLPVLPAAIPGAAPIALYRPEVPVWSVLPPAAAQLALNALGTFHDRQGAQPLLDQTGSFSSGWARIYGRHLDQTWAGTVTPRLDGSLSGLQVGHDLYSQRSDAMTWRVGVFVGHSRLRGDVNGFSDAVEDNRAGTLKLQGDSYGVYWTLINPHGAYLDTVLMSTRFDGDSRSIRGARLDNRGHALSASVESGYPLSINDRWTLEPQVQLIHQAVSLDSQNDGVSRVSFDADNRLTARLGARIVGHYRLQGRVLEPYLRANLWHTFSGTDAVTFADTDVIRSQQKASTADLGMGMALRLDRTVSVYASTDYSHNIDSTDQRSVSANLGIRIDW
ncbi:autotransporter outer membrane beta-barrel domain-containing protein [Pseudomonas sp. BW7P1]|uniref:autotransporter family protein n=1 Tax=Pseudomonas TaxID=286 RepID=UPI0021ADA68F|nr:autotransporter outer membrane beta-barrel domain-containing protein [Pseudomonas sp. BW7P1]UWI64292.1 autotransporter outer membrane beta-barrel domain-containing protein [Pseudomonas sp. BW7P1]